MYKIYKKIYEVGKKKKKNMWGCCASVGAEFPKCPKRSYSKNEIKNDLRKNENNYLVT